MEKINILINIFLIFAGISAFDIQAAAKQPRDEDVRPMQEGEDKSETPTTGTRRRREEDKESQRPVKQKVESEEKKSEEKKEELPPEIQKANQLLWDAVKANNIEQVKEALAKGADVNLDSNGLTLLMGASSNGYAEIVQLLLAKGANINLQDKEGSTALMYASFHGQTESVTLLLKKGANVNVQNKYGETALTIAKKIHDKDGKIVKLLLEHGADISIKPKELSEFQKATNLLTQAVFSNNTEQVKEAIRQGAYVNHVGKDDNTLLMIITEKGNTEIVKLLLDNGASINNQNKKGATALIIASYHGNAEIVKLLLEKNANVNVQDTEGRTALMIASEKGYDKIVNLLLPRANVNIKDKWGYTALIWASANGHAEIVKLLLENGANVNVQNMNGSTALMIASGKGFAHIVDKNKADVNLKDKKGRIAITYTTFEKPIDKSQMEIIIKLLHERKTEIIKANTLLYYAVNRSNADQVKEAFEKGADANTALIHASKVSNTEIVKLILDNGADVNIKDENGETALMKAVNNRPEVVKLLLDNGADPNVQDRNYGWTALMYVSMDNNKPEIVKLLLEHGANINLQNTNRDTALMIASKRGETEIVKLLHEKQKAQELLYQGVLSNNAEQVKEAIRQGVPVNLVYSNGLTLLMIASANGNAEIVALLAKKSNINAKDILGNTALMYASDKGHIGIVKLLLELGADINAVNNNGSTALFLAPGLGKVNAEIVALLLSKKADVNIKDKSGNTVLMYTSENGPAEIIKLLLDRGADVNAKGKNNFTPLMGASLKGHADIVKLLLAKGANIEIKNNDGNTALILASRYGHAAVVKLLLEHGADVTIKNKEGKTALNYINANPKLQEVLKEYHSQLSKKITEAGLISVLSDIAADYLAPFPKPEKKSGKSEHLTIPEISKGSGPGKS